MTIKAFRFSVWRFTMKKMSSLFLIIFLGHFAWGTRAFPMDAWDNENNPDNFSLHYERAFSKLPLEGELSSRPWSGDYWPTYKGGITYRWNSDFDRESERWTYPISSQIDISRLSPAEKYDLFLGDLEFGLTRYERMRTGVMKTAPHHFLYDDSFEIPKWEGLCHAWAPATYLYKNPSPVVMIGKLGHEIPFGSSDIKALLVYFLHLEGENLKTKFLGSRCNLDFTKLKESVENGRLSIESFKEKINSKNCRDTNAGSFHIGLTNEVGLQKTSFIVDITRDQEVWNQPVVGYRSKILQRSKFPQKGSAPETVEEVLVKTTMAYIEEVEQTWDKEERPDSVQEVTYYYWLELDVEGKILGGSWKSPERPDFIWKTTRPKFTGFFKDLGKIYKKSISE